MAYLQSCCSFTNFKNENLSWPIIYSVRLVVKPRGLGFWTTPLNSRASCVICTIPLISWLTHRHLSTQRTVFTRASVNGRIIRQKIWPKCPKLDGLAYEYAQNKMAGVHVRQKLTSRLTIWFDDHSALLLLWFVFQFDQSGGLPVASS